MLLTLASMLAFSSAVSAANFEPQIPTLRHVRAELASSLALHGNEMGAKPPRVEVLAPGLVIVRNALSGAQLRDLPTRLHPTLPPRLTHYNTRSAYFDTASSTLIHARASQKRSRSYSHARRSG